MKEFKGIFPAIMTPFDVQGQVSEVALRKTVKYSLDTGVDGFYICGGGGEGLFLTVPERQNILEIVQSLSNKYNKPLSIRFVSDGKSKIGEKTSFNNKYLKDVIIRKL